MKKKTKAHLRRLKTGKVVRVNSTDSNANKNYEIDVEGNKNNRVVRYESVESPSKKFESRTRAFRNIVSPISSATDSTVRIYKVLNSNNRSASSNSNPLDSALKLKRLMNNSKTINTIDFNNNNIYLSDFRKPRADKGKQRLRRGLNIAKDVLIGSALLGAGYKGMQYLGKKNFYPKIIRDDAMRNIQGAVLSKKLPKMSSIVDNRVIDDIASRSNENIKNAMSVVMPATALAGVTVGADYITGRKHDLPITKKIRQSGFNSTLINSLSNFRSEAKQHTRRLKSGKVITVNKGVKGQVLKPSKGDLWTKIGLPSDSSPLTLKGTIGKSMLMGAIGGGLLSAGAAASVPSLILPAAAIGATDLALKSGLASTGIYGIRRRMREGVSKK